MSPQNKPDLERSLWLSKEGAIAAVALVAIAVHLVLRSGFDASTAVFGITGWNLPLVAALILGGIPLVIDLLRHLLRGEFNADLLAGISIVTAVLLREYLAGTLVVLMLKLYRSSRNHRIKSMDAPLGVVLPCQGRQSRRLWRS